MRLDLNLLEVFCSVYEEGSFSKTAQKLRLSQPTISGHIKNLEDYLGTRLFDRLPRKVAPTRAGEILYRRGRAILNEKEGAIQELKKFLNGFEGSLTISASTIPGEYLMPQVIASFLKLFPAVTIKLNISDSKAVLDDVLNGKVELGFAGAKQEAVGSDFIRFASDELVLVAPNNQEWRGVETISMDELSAMPMIFREAGSGTRSAFEKRAGRAASTFNAVGYFGSTGAIKEAIRAGLGVSVLSGLAVKSEIESGMFKAISIEGLGPLRRDFFAVLNKHLTLSPIAEEFLNFTLNQSVSAAGRASSKGKKITASEVK
jgi:DNA-binding transcriptional LysR family regulator